MYAQSIRPTCAKNALSAVTLKYTVNSDPLAPSGLWRKEMPV